MNSRMFSAIALAFISINTAYAAADVPRWVEIAAKDKYERTRLVNMGLSIEFTRTGSVWGFADAKTLDRLKAKQFRVLHNFDAQYGASHDGSLWDEKDFPTKDAAYHNLAEVEAILKELQQKHPTLAKLESIGTSVEGRSMWAIHINSNASDLASGNSHKPGVFYMGAHHAREHLSVEVPLMFAQYLLEHQDDAAIARLTDTRDIWIVPMVNPDGAEFDISTGKYKMWRKNRRDNGDHTSGVDLNRNYSFGWAQGGSSTDTSSDIYMGPQPFSEPETQAIKRFVETHSNLKTLLSLHSFSELVLYPWSYKFDPLTNAQDLAIFKKMAKTMAGWNKYKDEQSSALYIASGETCDWAYGDHGIYAFTFELSPGGGTIGGMLQGGFYPGVKMITKAFEANLKPMLYLLDLTDDPGRAISGHLTGGLQNYVEPQMSPELFWEEHPFSKL